MTQPTSIGAFFKLDVSVSGLLSMCGTLLCLFTLSGFFGDLAWFVDATTHFRAQYLVLLLLLAVFFGLARKFRRLVLFAVFGLVNLFPLLPLFQGAAEEPLPGVVRLRAMLINVQINNQAYGKVDQMIREYDPDFLVLLEIDDTWLDKLSCLAERYPHHESRARYDCFGIALYSKYPLVSSETVRVCKGSLPSVLGRFESEGRRLALFGTHPLPPWGRRFTLARDEQLGATPALLAKETAPLMILGDLNCTPWSLTFQRLASATGCQDTAPGWGYQPTWPAGPLPLWIPLDHCLCSPGIRVLHREVGPSIGSDHYPVIVDFQLPLPNSEEN